jgi:hypothetical protein
MGGTNGTTNMNNDIGVTPIIQEEEEQDAAEKK